MKKTGIRIVDMVAGGAILSMATGSWLFRQNEAALTFSKVLLIYNPAVVFTVIFAFVFSKFTSIPFLLMEEFISSRLYGD